MCMMPNGFKSKSIIVAFLLSFIFSMLNGQNLEVKNTMNTVLKFPWTGGMDACQFGAVDLDMNGVMDLVVFDRRGNRMMCFINESISNEIAYRYAPEYRQYLPECFDWVVFADYNNDGKTDIFTYSPGWAGMRVFKNTSQSTLQFTSVVSPFLKSFQGSGYVNIIATNADYPAVVDIDGDGDLDLLTFWALGTYIELHKNQSIEKYNHADSLDFIKTNFCWGRVAENDESNQIYLDTCLFNSQMNFRKEGLRHRGATMLVSDFTGNGLPDMLLADVGYPGLTLLRNGGTMASAFITSQDTAFPSNDVPLRLFSMPAAAMIDVNNDGKKDLIVSPFDPSLYVAENHASIWLYLNEGTTALPQFKLYTKRFLQNQTIDHGSGAYPVLFDLNSNGIKDLIVGNIGTYVRSWYSGNTLHSQLISQIAVYENIGTNQQAAFQLVQSDLAGLSSLKLRGLVPTFADLTGNGLPDMLVGNELGKLIFVEQTSLHVWEVRTTQFQNISAGSWSAPQLFDVNEDGIVDLLIGSKNGKIAYYRGSNANGVISFSFITSSFGNVNVTDFMLSYDGYSTPCFFYSPSGDLMLLSGSEQGKLFLFDHIRGNLSGTFREVNNWQSIIASNSTSIDVGIRSAGCLGQLESNGNLKLIAGNFSGGLQLFNGNIQVTPMVNEMQEIKFEISPNPAADHIFIQLQDNFQSEVEVRIFSSNGVQHLIENFNSLNQGIHLNVAFLPKGMYFVKLKGKSAFSVKKFVKL